jgi:hypothetical protein
MTVFLVGHGNRLGHNEGLMRFPFRLANAGETDPRRAAQLWRATALGKKR